MLDERDIQLHVLELEYKDYLSRREVIHYAQWAVPLGWVTGIVAVGVAAGWVQSGNIVAFGLVGFGALVLYAGIQKQRKQEELNLEALRIVITHLPERERLPRRLEPREPQPLTIAGRFTVLLLAIALVTLLFFQAMIKSVSGFVAYVIILILLVGWFVKRARDTSKKISHRKRHERTRPQKRH